MKILIAISSKKYSSQTLDVGMSVAKAFSAKTTIVDVGDKINQFSLKEVGVARERICLLYTSPSPRDRQKSRMPSSA